jgi:hypothetical protein
MTTLHFQTHVSESGVITLPLPDSFRGGDISVRVDVRPKAKSEISLDELCGAGWVDDERSTDEIIREIYEARTDTQEQKRVFEELCKPWREDERSTEEIIRDIYESRTRIREMEAL